MDFTIELSLNVLCISDLHHSTHLVFTLIRGNSYSSPKISKILIAAVEIGVPGPKIAAAPSLYN